MAAYMYRASQAPATIRANKERPGLPRLVAALLSARGVGGICG
jgi:hypothetical protein